MITMPIRNEADVYAAVSLGRRMAEKLEFEPKAQIQLETIIIELTSNALRRGGGTIALRSVQRDSPRLDSNAQRPSAGSGQPGALRQAGVEITVEDRKPYLDLARILAGNEAAADMDMCAWSASQLADEFAIDNAQPRGTRIRACKWSAAV